MKRGTPRHPKVYDLLQALGLPLRSRPVVVGYLELLWHFTAEFAPQGDIGRYTDDRIEGALDWTGKRGKLIEALTTSKWCDKSSRHRLVVHDWDQHADDATRKKLIRANLQFVEVSEELTGQCPPSVPTTADNGGLPEPLPLPLPEPSLAVVGGKAANKHPPKSWFDENHDVFYGGYWNHTSKQDSRRAYEKRVKQLVADQGMTHDEAAAFLVGERDAYRKRFEGVESWKWRKNLHPATWVNGEKWTDEAEVGLFSGGHTEYPRLEL